jgi:hypothetical protein
MHLFPNLVHSLSFTVVSTTADSLRDKAAVFGDTIKETSCIIVFLELVIYQQMHYLLHLERYNLTQEIT